VKTLGFGACAAYVRAPHCDVGAGCGRARAGTESLAFDARIKRFAALGVRGDSGYVLAMLKPLRASTSAKSLVSLSRGA